MRAIAAIALCLISSFATADKPKMEEVVVVATQIVLPAVKLASNHRQSPITGNWYYVEQKKETKSQG